MKRTLLFVFIGVIIAGISILIFRPKDTTPAPTTGGATGTPSIALPVPTQTPTAPSPTTQTARSSVTLLAANEDVAAFYQIDASTLLIVKKNGSVVKKTGAGEIQIIPEGSPIFSPSFSFDGKKLLGILGTPGQWSVFDFTKEVWTLLPPAATAAVWAPHDYRVAYIVSTSNTATTVRVSDFGRAQPTTNDIVRFHAQDMSLGWINGKTLFAADKPSAWSSGAPWAIDITSGTLTPLTGTAAGVSFLWDANGTRGLFFRADETTHQGGMLSLISSAGTPANTFTFLTLPSKCAFEPLQSTSSPEFLDCAVPRDTGDFSGETLPDAYRAREFFTQDDIYRINLSDGTVTALFQGSSFDVDGAAVAHGSFIFINRYDGNLYAVTLQASS